MNGTIVHSRERLAWSMLLVSFALFVCLAVSVPIGLNAFLQSATRPLVNMVQANQGVVSINDPTGSRRAILTDEPAEPVEAGARIVTDATATAILLAYTPGGTQPLARLQVYGNTDLFLEKATIPRFSISDQPQELRLELLNGRLQLVIPETVGRPFVLFLTTPQGATITIRQPGQYSVQVGDDRTQVTVHEGIATILAAEESVDLLPNQRVEILAGAAPTQPLDPERNLIRNGSFDDRFDQWSLFTWRVELPEQPKGQADFVTVAGEPALHIVRQGQGHADVRLTQRINEDVADYESLRLQVTFRIVNQSLGVCGIQGSECPLFINISYIDQSGISNIWQHGFYAVGEVDDNSTPGACVSCAVVQGPHERVPMGQVYFYETDIQDELARQGVRPLSFITDLSIIASGHTFEIEVIDIALRAIERLES